MKRVTAAGTKPSGKLAILNLLTVVGYSYIKKKLEYLYDHLSVKAADGQISSNVRMLYFPEYS